MLQRFQLQVGFALANIDKADQEYAVVSRYYIHANLQSTAAVQEIHACINIFSNLHG